MKKIISILLFFVSSILLFGKSDKFQNSTDIISLKVDMNGTLDWKTKNETGKKIFVIELYKWNKWIEIGQVAMIGTPGEHQYQFNSQPHYGENDYRISIKEEPNTIKIVKFTSNAPEVTFTIHKKPKEIEFTGKTMYEIIDKKGVLVKKGFAATVPLKDLHRGHYILNYDNFSASFKL